MATAESTFARLSRSAFRSRFHLSDRDIAYIRSHGMDAIASHARDFIRDRLAKAEPANDGRQTPMRGHPVFVAQHACACCCRGCLETWYHIPRHIPLSDAVQDRIVRLLMAWIERELSVKGDKT